MPNTFKAILGRDGKLRLRDKIRFSRDRKVLVTVLDDGLEDESQFSSNLSESSLSKDWNRAEEDKAWQHLQ
ncbi:MAG: hypothetical protein BMS9Abin05_2354 [Rhodothermia bacterium]|nr:MAG: hypothetical protein BMS9Abin05_2354 [Rhodothermia bacterium]